MIFLSNDQLLKATKIVASILISSIVILVPIYIFFAVKKYPGTSQNTFAFVEYAWPLVSIAVAVNAVMIYDLLSILLWRIGVHRDDVQFKWKHHPAPEGWLNKLEQEEWERKLLILPYTPSSDKYYLYPMIFLLSLVFLFWVGSSSYDRSSAGSTTSNPHIFDGDARQDVANAR